MCKFKKIVLCILCIILFTSTVYGKKKNDNELLKVFVSKEKLDLSGIRNKNLAGLFTNIGNWENKLVYSQLKKLKKPFKLIKKNENCDIKIIPKTFNPTKKKIDLYKIKDGSYSDGYMFVATYDLAFSVELRVLDSNDYELAFIAEKFIERGEGTSSSSVETAIDRAEREAIKNIKKEFLPIIYKELSNNKKIRQYAMYIAKTNSLSNDSMKKTLNNIIWSGYLCKENTHSNTPFKTIKEIIQNSINTFLLPRNAIDINPKIPPVIKKPELPSLPTLVKSQFEKKEMFDKRVQEAMDKRQLQINVLQETYRKDVEERNIIIEQLTLEYENDIEKIKEEQKQKKEKLPEKVMEFTRNAFFEVMGEPILENPVYDAETEIMYVDLKASNSDYQKRISLNIPLSIAEEFYSKINEVDPIAIYSIEDNSINLNQIKVNYNNEQYIATLTDEDFKPETIEVALEDKKIDFDSEQQMNLELQNPNLIDTYRVSAIHYGESPDAKGLTYNDDITPLVEKLESKPEDPKKWLFIIAVEDYDETDPVVFSKNSAVLFKETAQKVFGIKDRNTYALIENEATSGKIKDNLQRLIDNVKEGDIIYFYYSGHGVPVPKSQESFILPKDKIVDYISKESEFNLSNIYKKLSDSKAEKVFAFIDACFSGKTDNIPLFKGVAPGLIKTKEIQFNIEKMVILTAGKDNQFSNSFDEKGHRMFSYYLIKSLIDSKKHDLNLIYKDISVQVHDASFEKGDAYIQDPQIYGNKNLKLFSEEE